MPHNTRITAAPMLTHPCPACNRPTRSDGYCRTRTCPNQVPDYLVAPAREAALAHWRDLRAAAQNRQDTTP